ncbi:MAG: MiaB/RimO family radical SAM methylthiotransferase [Candidatus Omnitrophica bacterium]|nr:MiaB/RimO family radical SAM methylthiotransferase [Candidatus Omnitrophota bacterium]
MKRYILYSNGCYLNRIDTKRIEIFLKKNGYTLSDNLRDSDIIIFNTCAYCKEMEDECIKFLENIQRLKTKKSKLIIAGCLPVINKKRLLANFRGPYFNPLSMDSLVEFIGAKHKEIDTIPTAQPILTDDNTFNQKPQKIFAIRISYGCLNRCSFCAVKNVFPKLHSKDKKEILEQFLGGLKSGYKTFLLTGEDTSCYGKDTGTDLTELLMDIVKIKSEFNIYLYRLNPDGLLKMGKDFLNVLKSKKIKYLSIPINSGSNRILSLMNRNYKAEEIKNYIKKLKKLYPFIRLNLDIMVGFPTETWKDFQDTQRFVCETKPDNIRVFKFSKRPNTPAYYLGRLIPKSTMQKRSNILYKTFRFIKYK